MLDRFSARARMAVANAEAEAGQFGHHHIGTEHLLLGVMTDGDSNEAKAIKAAGATLGGAREKVAEAVGTKRDTYEGDPQFTARAKRAIDRASRFSIQRRDEQVDVEHLLLGVLDVEGTACQVLRGLGVDVVGLRRAVETQVIEPEVETEQETAVPRLPVPRCGQCGTSLEDGLHHRTLTATDDTGTGRDVVVVCCAACGTVIGTA